MAESRIRISKQLQKSTNPGAVLITDSSSEMSFLEAISGSDKLIFYDDSAGAVTWLTVGTNLSITGTTLNASAGAGGYTEVQEEGSALAAQSKLNFIGDGITAADDGANSRTNVTLDATLNALAAYNTDGILVQTAADTFTGRTLQSPVSGFTIVNANGVGGNPTFALSHDLAALEGLTGTGFAVRTGLSAWTNRTITGTANRIVVTNGDGISGNPTLDVGTDIAVLNENETVSGTWTFSNNITLNGTPSAGTDVTNVTFVNTAIANAIAGLRKGSVRAATTTAGTLATSFANGQVVDGVTLATGNLILIKDQSSAAENGVYTVNASGAPTRATWMDAASEIDGVYVAVEDGTTLAGTLWITVSEVTTLDTDPITFTQIQTAGTIDGSGDVNRIAIWSDADTLTSDALLFYHPTNDTMMIGVNSAFSNSFVSIKGKGATSGTNSFEIRNSSDILAFRVTDAPLVEIGPGFSFPLQLNSSGITRNGDIFLRTTNTSGEVTIETTGTSSGKINLAVTGGTSSAYINAYPTAAFTATSGDRDIFVVNGSFAPTSGTATFAATMISPTINQTGGANGITRSLYVAPTITASADHRALEITSSASHYALYSTAGKVRFDLGSDAEGDLLTRGSGGNLERIAAGTSGYALISNGAGTAPTWQAISSGTVTRAFIEGSTSSTIDLDANTGVVKDVDGTNVAFTAPTDKNKFFVYRNGQKISETGTLTTRDYSINTTTHVLTLSRALDASEILEVVKFA